MERKGLMMILDGVGNATPSKFNAFLNANTPFIDQLSKKYLRSAVDTSGMAVGLPNGQMGNSEVGHTNIGAGRVVYQDFTKISKSIADGEFPKNDVIDNLLNKVKTKGSTLHLIGLFSDGGVHSDIAHLKAIIEAAAAKGIESVRVNALLDGRDRPPRSAAAYFKDFDLFLKNYGDKDYKVNMVTGRFYAMDRDNRWNRVSQAYLAMTAGAGDSYSDWKTGLDANYAADRNDEFVLPFKLDGYKPISDNDGIFFFNFRSDRAREISHAFLDDDFEGFDRGAKIDLCGYVSMTEYQSTLPTQIAFPSSDLTQTMGEVISSAGHKQLRIAETEKYAHVTFFFNGGVEAKFPGEDRILIPSPQDVETYDEKPEMSIYAVTEKLVEAIKTDQYKLIILNFANGDMVGHTGIYDAAVKAIEAVDDCLSKVIPVANEHNYATLISADHGNSEEMWNAEANAPHTQHTTNPVPLWLINAPEVKKLKNGSLRDLSPTMLDLLGIAKPEVMDGSSLLVK